MCQYLDYIMLNFLTEMLGILAVLFKQEDDYYLQLQ